MEEGEKSTNAEYFAFLNEFLKQDRKFLKGRLRSKVRERELKSQKINDVQYGERGRQHF